MNYGELKRAARACLAGSSTAYARLTLLFLLCLFAFTIPCDTVAWLLNAQLARLSGLSAMAGRNRIVLWSLVISVASSLAASLWQIGYQAFALRLSRKEEASFRTFLTAFHQFDQFLLLLLLQGVLIFLWSLLFMIPGIVAAYRYRMAAFAMLDNPSLSATDALSVSKRLTYGHKLELFCLDLSFLWYTLPLALFSSMVLLPDFFPALSDAACQLALYVGSVVLLLVWQRIFAPFVSVTMAHAYGWLLHLDRSRRPSVFEDWPE